MGQAAQDMSRMNIQGHGTAEQYRGTIIPPKNFSAEKDAEILRKAMKGIGG